MPGELENRFSLTRSRTLPPWPGVPERVTPLAFSPDGELLALAVENGIQLREVRSGEAQTTLTRLERIQCLAFCL